MKTIYRLRYGRYPDKPAFAHCSYIQNDEDTYDMDDSPYCECGNEPDEDEQAENQCACCGRPLE